MMQVDINEIDVNFCHFIHRALARSENLGGHIVLGGDNVPPPPACDRPA